MILRNHYLSVLMFLCAVFGHVGVAYGLDCGDGGQEIDDACVCDAGYYVDDNGVCAICDAGFYCADGDTMVQCDDNYVSDAGAVVCVACSGETPYSYNNQCVACTGAGQYVNNGVCDVCERGKYPNTAHTSCTTCKGSGQYVNNGVCDVCASGTYPNTSHNECLTCTDGGQYVNNGVCKTCNIGTYPDSTHTSCITCTGLGQYVNNGVCDVCESGTYPNTSHNACVTCTNAGQYVNNGVCDVCTAGNYINDGICITCPAGFYCTGDGTAKQCDGNTRSDAGAEVCTECSGERLVNADHTKCDHCPTGYCMFNNQAQIQNKCIKCKAGYECPVNPNGYPISCSALGQPMQSGTEDYQCEAGEYSTAGSAACSKCPAGYGTGGIKGSTSISDCKPIPVKLYFNDNESVELPACLTPGKTNNKVIVQNSNENN